MTIYNDTDTKVCAWLRELIAHGHIMEGTVDERSIAELTGDDLRYFTRVHLFAGIGGWDYALKLAGWPADRLVWTGSCPCQPFSSAGRRGAEGDERHLWPEMFRLIRECSPPVVFGEQVASKAGRAWLAGIRADLESLGYAVGAADLCAAGIGAPHIRQRLYWVADAEQARAEVGAKARIATDCDETTSRPGPKWEGIAWGTNAYWDMPDGRRRCERGALPLVDGISERMDTIGGYGNAIVPQVAAEFVRAYMECKPLERSL